MGAITEPRPVLLIVAVFSRHQAGLDWAREKAKSHWGEIALTSQIFSFDDTKYYEKTMGPELKKVFFAFERLIDPTELIDAKRLTNDWEDHFRDRNNFAEARPLNLDPGYVTEAKLVLATTKDRDHRLYLGRGIFAEVTLHYFRRSWTSHPWTYPDYQSAGYHEFLTGCREYLRKRYREG